MGEEAKWAGDEVYSVSFPVAASLGQLHPLEASARLLTAGQDFPFFLEQLL